MRRKAFPWGRGIDVALGSTESPVNQECQGSEPSAEHRAVEIIADVPTSIAGRPRATAARAVTVHGHG